MRPLEYLGVRDVREATGPDTWGEGQVLESRTCAAEGLDGKELALLHLGCWAALHNGDALAAMDLVWAYGVPIEIPHTLDLSPHDNSWSGQNACIARDGIMVWSGVNRQVKLHALQRCYTNKLHDAQRQVHCTAQEAKACLHTSQRKEWAGSRRTWCHIGDC